MAMALSRASRHLPREYNTCLCTSSGCTLSMRVKAANTNSESSQASVSCSVMIPASMLPHEGLQ
eukprot:6969066-Pyramimonas_sp.AAC.1